VTEVIVGVAPVAVEQITTARVLAAKVTLFDTIAWTVRVTPDGKPAEIARDGPPPPAASSTKNPIIPLLAEAAEAQSLVAWEASVS
jgi:hypothetical protein